MNASIAIPRRLFEDKFDNEKLEQDNSNNLIAAVIKKVMFSNLLSW